MFVLELRQIRKVFGEGKTAVRAVDGVNLKVKKGEVVLIMGPSGSGKTTLLSIAGGILRPTKGRVKLKGSVITDLGESELPQIRLENIGFIFQSFHLLSALTARENVEMAANLAGVKGKEAWGKIEKLLTDLGLEGRMDAVPAELSGGEKQRVSIARALINNPDIILADEPTANLDSKTGHEVVVLLRDIAKKKNKSVVIVSHDNRLRDVADRVLWLEDGKFKEIGKMAVDPVCQMPVEKGGHKTSHKGKNYYFCSKGCMKEFVNDPKEFMIRK
ncbi:MAG: ATP-binding cassette domain-containing protein [Patescibacteria group bacterium]